MTELVAKRGDTLTLTATRTDSGGSAVDVSTMTITSSIERRGTSISLTVEKTDPVNGEVTLNATAETTAAWVPGLYRGDIQFVTDSETASTENFLIEVREDVTGAG